MLELDGVVAGYARSSVLHGLSLKLPERSVVGLLGPNGAGKTTVAKTTSALLQFRAGAIRFKGADIHGMKLEEIVRRGITHVPHALPGADVQENLEMGAYLSPNRAETARNLSLVHNLFPILKERRSQLAGLMSGGEQQMLAVGRAMMVRSAALLLDEPRPRITFMSVSRKSSAIPASVPTRGSLPKTNFCFSRALPRRA
jgi:branched-chain amino acid transport system ATP-binding protein